MKIGIVGTNFSNGNKGVVALGISAIKIIEDVANENNLDVSYCIFIKGNPANNNEAFLILKKYLGIDKSRITICNYNAKKIHSLYRLSKEVGKCKFVMDYTEGDSFTDIYGMKRLMLHSIIKYFEIKGNNNLVLAPQTYGPFKKNISKKISTWILCKAKLVISRDKLSVEEINKLTKKINVIVATDVAFELPYNRNDKSVSEKTKIGINISGLLWNGGYSGNNQFDLKLNYREYCENIIEMLKKDGSYEIHLIPHVIAESKTENDYKVCKELCEKYKGVILADKFKDPIEAKNYIANMNVLIGARMHATIAAVSSGVLAIPIAYSRKFKGLYENIGYNHIIDARKVETNNAINLTMSLIRNVDKYNNDLVRTKEIVREKIKILKDELLKLMI